MQNLSKAAKPGLGKKFRSKPLVLASDDYEGINLDQLEAKDLIKLELLKEDVKSDSTQVEEKLKPNDSDNIKEKFTVAHNHETSKSQHKDLKDALCMLSTIYQDKEDTSVNTSINVSQHC